MMTKTITVTKNDFSEEGLNDIIKELNIDINVWELASFKVTDGKWTVLSKKRDQNLQWVDGVMNGHAIRENEWLEGENKVYKIEMTFRHKPIENQVLESFKEVIKDMPIPRALPRKKSFNTGIAAEMTTFDAHIAKLAWLHETGYRNYDLKIALQDYKYANDENLELISRHKPDKIFYIIGQDLYHMDNMSSHTTNGEHTLDVDGRITKVHKEAFDVSIANITNCAKIANEVEIIWIPGNHDFLSSYMLAFAVEQYFRNSRNILTDTSQNARKARLWGTLLVGWTHRIVGKHTVWSNELAQQFPELWGKSVFREWHHGDQHKKQDVKITPIFTSGGVICRQITALSPVDKWHTDNVFTDAVPGGECFLWSKDRGVFGNFVTWTGQYEKNRNELIKKSQINKSNQ